MCLGCIIEKDLLLTYLLFKIMALFILIVVLVIAWWIYSKFFRDPSYVRNAYDGKNQEQKEVIRYFLVDGCMRKKMSDAEYDAFVQKSVPGLKQRGMDKIGLDEDQLKEIEPVHFEGFVFDKDSYHKKGEDGIWRSSKYEVTWLFFSDSQVYLYKKIMSFDELKDKEITEEYFYKDITNFSTRSESEEITIDGVTVQVDSTQFRLIVPGDSFSCKMDQNEYTERAVQGMKAKLREKKLA